MRRMARSIGLGCDRSVFRADQQTVLFLLLHEVLVGIRLWMLVVLGVVRANRIMTKGRMVGAGVHLVAADGVRSNG